MPRSVAGPRVVLALSLALGGCLAEDAPAAGSPPAAGPAAAQATPPRDRAQPRPHGTRVAVDPARVGIDDGDTITIRWTRGGTETVRILGIDTPETRHLEHDSPSAQPFGEEAQRFARDAFAGASRIELLRSATVDPYGRTLAYLFLDGENYSVLVVRARLALESVSHFGDNGLPEEAADVLAAAKAAGPVPFEAPHRYRARMRELSQYMREQGTYPEE